MLLLTINHRWSYWNGLSCTSIKGFADKYPEGRFDLMLTLPHDPRKALRYRKSGNIRSIARHENIRNECASTAEGQQMPLLAANRSKLGNRFSSPSRRSVRDLLKLSDFQDCLVCEWWVQDTHHSSKWLFRQLRTFRTPVYQSISTTKQMQRDKEFVPLDLKIWDWKAGSGHDSCGNGRCGKSSHPTAM